jgi:hypothetical protein
MFVVVVVIAHACLCSVAILAAARDVGSGGGSDDGDDDDDNDGDIDAEILRAAQSGVPLESLAHLLMVQCRTLTRLGTLLHCMPPPRARALPPPPHTY